MVQARVSAVHRTGPGTLKVRIWDLWASTECPQNMIPPFNLNFYSMPQFLLCFSHHRWGYLGWQPSRAEVAQMGRLQLPLTWQPAKPTGTFPRSLYVCLPTFAAVPFPGPLLNVSPTLWGKATAQGSGGTAWSFPPALSQWSASGPALAQHDVLGCPEGQQSPQHNSAAGWTHGAHELCVGPELRALGLWVPM